MTTIQWLSKVMCGVSRGQEKCLSPNLFVRNPFITTNHRWFPPPSLTVTSPPGLVGRHVTSVKMAAPTAAGMPVFLGPEQVEKYLDFKSLYRVLTYAFSLFSKGKSGGILQPVRTVLPIEKHSGFYGLMPAFSENDDVFGTKLVSVFPNNTHIPSHQAVIVIHDATDGRVTAVMDGNVITDVRTAMASCVATKVIKNPSAPIILAILGAGAQGISHHKVFSKFFDLSEVRIWNRTLSKAEKVAEQLGAKAFESAEEAVKNADVIITVTSSQEPVLMKGWLKPGAHVNCVGACRPTWQEIDPNLMRNATVFCDSREAALKESGDIILSEADIYGEVGELINGTVSAVGSDKTTIFKSLGMAIEDVVSAKLVYDRYMEDRV